jgi:hypothetical protein
MEQYARSGNTLISALIGAGFSMAVLTGVATMIQYSQRTAMSSRGLSEAGMLADSIRSAVADPARCASVLNSGLPSAVPAGALAVGGSGVALSRLQVGPAASPTTLVSVGQSYGSIQLDGIQLKRIEAGLATLNLQVRKSEQALGAKAISIPALFLSVQVNASGALTNCALGRLSGGGEFESWTSSNLSISTAYTNGYIEVAHTLGGVPQVVNWVVVCQAAGGCNVVTREASVKKYEYGDEVDLESTYTSGGVDFNARATFRNSTHVGLTWHNNIGCCPIGSIRRGDSILTGADEIVLSHPDWALKVYALRWTD